MPIELLSIKIEESNSNKILFGFQLESNFSPHVHLFLQFFVASELLGKKTKEFISNYILNHIYIYIYNEKPLYTLEMYDLKKV